MNQSKIWDYYQGEGVENFNNAIPRLEYLFNMAIKNISNNAPTILNIGYGNGWIEKKCAEHGWNIFSLDPGHNESNKNTNEITYVKGVIEDMPFSDNQFDLVFCSEVLEHLNDAELKSGISEIKRALKDNGILIGTVPYKEILSENIAVCPKCGVKFHRWGHHQEFDENKLRYIFETNNLGVIKLKSKAFQDYSEFTIKNFIKYMVRVPLGMISSTLIYSNLLFMVNKK